MIFILFYLLFGTIISFFYFFLFWPSKVRSMRFGWIKLQSAHDITHRGKKIKARVIKSPHAAFSFHTLS